MSNHTWKPIKRKWMTAAGCSQCPGYEGPRRSDAHRAFKDFQKHEKGS
jgi:hypothetical protein